MSSSTNAVVVDTPTLAALRAARGSGRRRLKRSSIGDGCVAAYLRVSGDEQKATGLGLEAQEASIIAECERRDITQVMFFKDEAVSGKIPPDRRPGLADAICALDRGEASILMVAKVDRLARSFADLALISQLGARAGWEVIALNCPMDTTTTSGKLLWNMLGLVADLEAAMGSDRMRAVAAVRRARGEVLGRPSKVTAESKARIRELRASGFTWAATAAQMNLEGYVTSTGGIWHPTTCQRHCGAL